MSEQNGQFRSAAFGGFHRQDVLDYVEQLTKEKQELASRLETETNARTEAESRLAEAEEASRAAREAQEAMSGELDYLHGELEARTAALSRAEEELKILRGQVETLRPGAESWEHIKEQAGSIELAAHERAQVTIQDAHTQAAEIQSEGVRWVLDIQSGCDRLQTDLKQSLRAAEAQLENARTSFRQAEKEMEGYQASLAGLLSRIGPEAGPNEAGQPAAEKTAPAQETAPAEEDVREQDI